MDEQDQAQQALTEMFRRDRAKAEAHPARKPRWELGPLSLPWLLAIAVVIFVLAPSAFLVIYPRFGPVDTMTSFCTAESDGEYATAYALLSKRAQQHESLDEFTNASRASNLISCTTNHGIPFIFGGTQAQLDVHFQFYGDSTGIDGVMMFVREHGEWRVDSISPVMF
jgi:hypothetical protein